MRVLIADDDRLICKMLTLFVEECGHEVVGSVFAGGLAVMKAFAETLPDAVLLDVFMPRCNGLTVCHAIQSRKPDTKVIFMSGMVDPDHPYVAGCRAHAFLRKPMLIEDVRKALASLEQPVALPQQALTIVRAETAVAA
jgi:DNA-binding response OmpR family regulator